MKLKRSYEGEDISKRTIKNYSAKEIVADIKSGTITTIAVGNAPRKVVVAQRATGDPKVSIANFAFVPQVVTIAPGDSVTWSNDDGAPHTITFKDGSSGSDTFYPGKTYSRTFDQPGNYD